MPPPKSLPTFFFSYNRLDDEEIRINGFSLDKMIDAGWP
jgi:hypothetical protein